MRWLQVVVLLSVAVACDSKKLAAIPPELDASSAGGAGGEAGAGEQGGEAGQAGAGG